MTLEWKSVAAKVSFWFLIFLGGNVFLLYQDDSLVALLSRSDLRHPALLGLAVKAHFRRGPVVNLAFFPKLLGEGASSLDSLVASRPARLDMGPVHGHLNCGGGAEVRLTHPWGILREWALSFMVRLEHSGPLPQEGVSIIQTNRYGFKATPDGAELTLWINGICRRFWLPEIRLEGQRWHALAFLLSESDDENQNNESILEVMVNRGKFFKYRFSSEMPASGHERIRFGQNLSPGSDPVTVLIAGVHLFPRVKTSRDTYLQPGFDLCPSGNAYPSTLPEAMPPVPRDLTRLVLCAPGPFGVMRRFGGILSDLQPRGMAAVGDSLWIGTDHGLLRFLIRDAQWFHYDVHEHLTLPKWSVEVRHESVPPNANPPLEIVSPWEQGLLLKAFHPESNLFQLYWWAPPDKSGIPMSLGWGTWLAVLADRLMFARSTSDGEKGVEVLLAPLPSSEDIKQGLSSTSVVRCPGYPLAMFWENGRPGLFLGRSGAPSQGIEKGIPDFRASQWVSLGTSSPAISDLSPHMAVEGSGTWVLTADRVLRWRESSSSSRSVSLGGPPPPWLGCGNFGPILTADAVWCGTWKQFHRYDRKDQTVKTWSTGDEWPFDIVTAVAPATDGLWAAGTKYVPDLFHQSFSGLLFLPDR